MVEFSKTLLLDRSFYVVALQPQNCRNNFGLGYSPFVRHYQGNHYCFLFLCLLRCFSSAGLLSVTGMLDLQSSGLPHSEIFGSKLMCSSPKLIAAYHVLHRLWKPRHPPYALNYFLRLLETLCIYYSQYVKELVCIATKCGEYRSRTDDLLLAKQALQPAELIPLSVFYLVVPPRLELGTSTLSVQRSNQLSYETFRKAVQQ